MKILRAIHTAYGLLIFMLFFLFFLLPLLVPILFPRRFRWVGIINRWWAKATFTFCFLPYRVEGREFLDQKQNYIFCPNHFSYLDIPTMGLNPVNAIFVGKNDMGNIPLFSWMYRKLHITVDRAKLKSKYDSIVKSREAIDEGKSLVIYPEGGILATSPPEMVPFKDGAFRLAIEKQIPLVPVTIPYNWIILPSDQFLVRWGKVKVIFHKPIETRGMTMLEIGRLRDHVFHILEDELEKYGNRPGPVG